MAIKGVDLASLMSNLVAREPRGGAKWACLNYLFMLLDTFGYMESCTTARQFCTAIAILKLEVQVTESNYRY